MKKTIRLLILGFVLLLGSQSHATISPLGVAIFAPVQFPPSDFSITGARLSFLVGRHRHVYGIDLAGIGNITEQEFAGIGISGVFNSTRGQTTILGLQAAGAANLNNNKVNVWGLQIAGAVNSNVAQSTVVGLQAAIFANLSAYTKIYGAQIGLYNTAQEVFGFQIGLLNFTTDLHGVQIGLLNFYQNGLFKVSPILNVGF